MTRQSWMSDECWRREKNRCGKYYGYIYGTPRPPRDLSHYLVP